MTRVFMSKTVLALCMMTASVHPAFAQTTTATAPPSTTAPSQMGTAPGAPSAATQLPIAVQTTNQTFRDIYAKAKHDITAALGPVIIVNGEKVILIYGGKRSEEQMIPPNYHLLKTIDHITLGLFVALDAHYAEVSTETVYDTYPIAGGVFVPPIVGPKVQLTPVSKGPAVGLSPEEITNLQNLRDYALRSQKDLTSLNLEPSVLQRQNTLIDESVKFIDNALAQKQVTAAELQAYTRSIAPMTLENGFEAVSMELGNMNEAVKKWRDSMPASDWRKLYVIVMDGHMPRQQERHMQYFLQLLKEKEEGNHVIYTEGLSDESAAQDLLATHILDKRVAVAFYKDPWRMHRDFLSDGAKKYLKLHPAGR